MCPGLSSLPIIQTPLTGENTNGKQITEGVAKATSKGGGE